jgi:hypothetical protein
LRNLANFALFQLGWFACVYSAAAGHMWLGPGAVLAIVVLHLLFVAEREMRRRELVFILLVGLIGMLADTGLGALGATRYPTSESVWTALVVPPWITALWVLFATLPYHSLGWLKGRPVLAMIFGALGGPLTFLAGVRIGAVDAGDSLMLTYGSLAIEYALVTPLLLFLAQPPNSARQRASRR